MLRDFVAANRDEILARARRRVSVRSAPAATETELVRGLPKFLDQLRDALLHASSKSFSDHSELKETASQHGADLFQQGLTVEQVVQDYGDLCQVITGLAIEQRANIAADEFQMLNLCLDEAIAGAVGAYVGHRERAVSDQGTEKLGMLAHEMRNMLHAAMLSFASIKRGVVAPAGSTGTMLERSLVGLQTLIDRSLAEVRLDAGIQSPEEVPVWQVIEEAATGASIVARTRGLDLNVAPVDHAIYVKADHQILTAALANLLQNAIKFTRRDSVIALRVIATETRVLIEVEDSCGGLPPGQAENLLKPYVQAGRDRTGLGLGLTICVKSAKAMAGELRVRDLPGKGCVFTIDLPKHL